MHLLIWPARIAAVLWALAISGGASALITFVLEPLGFWGGVLFLPVVAATLVLGVAPLIVLSEAHERLRESREAA